MSKLLIRCINRDNLCSNKYHIIIYNENNEIVLNKYTDNCYSVFNNKNGIYKIIIIAPLHTYPSIFYSSFILNNDVHKLNYVFSNLYTIRLNELNYDNILVKEGEVILWPNRIQ